MAKLKILHLEDSVSDAKLVDRVLKKGNFDFETLLVQTKESFIAALDEFVPDLILSDHSLPSFNSHEALLIYTERQLKIPFILITSNVSEEFAVNVIKRGAEDYILKDRLERLPTAINNALEKYRLEKKNQRHLFELIKNERHYRALIENGGDVLMVFTEEGKPKYVSPSVQKVLGYTIEEAANLNLFEVVHPDDKEATVQRWAKALENPGVPLSGHERRMKNKKGEWVWLEVTMTNMLHDPAINGIVDNFRDITERKLARLQLIKTQQFNKSVLSSLDAHIAVIDQSGEIISVNKAWDNFAISNGGALPVTSTGSNYFHVCEHAAKRGSETAQQVLSGLKSVLDKQIDIFKLEYPCHSPVEERWFALNATSLGGDEKGIVISHQNISDRKLAEKKLIHANRLYSFISQINQTIVHVKDDQVLFNEACRIAVEFGKFKMAWIGLPSPTSDTIKLVASFGATSNQLNFFNDYRYETDGPIAKVINGLDYAIVGDIRDEVKIRMSEVAGAAGFKSVIVLPIKNGPALIATFNIYSTEAHYFNEDEIRLLTEATADISFAIQVFEKDKLRSIAEQQLLQSEAKLSNAQNIAKLGYWELNLKDKTLYWSDETYRIWGRTKETYNPTFQALIETIHPDDLELFISEQSVSAAADKELNIEYRIVLPDNSIRWVNDKGKLIKNDLGELISFEGTVQDITERKLTEFKLKKTENRYKQIVETAQEGIWLVNKEGKTTFVNKKMCQILEYSEKEVMESELFEYMDEEGKQMAMAAIDNERKGIASHADFKYITKSGREVWASVSASPFFDSEGNYSGSLAMISDITDKKALQDLLDKAIKLSRIGTFEVDLVRNQLYWSPMTKEIHEVPEDYTPDINSAINFYKEGHSRDTISEVFKLAIEQKKPFDLELEIITAKGNTRWVRAIGEAECRNDVCVRVYGSFQDIDKVKNAELEVLKAYEEKNDIIESIDDAFYAVDRNWDITYWNNNAEKVLGRGRTEVLNRNLWEVYPDVVHTVLWTQYTESLYDNKSRHFEFYYDTLDMWFDISAYPSPKGLSVFFKDITGRKSSESNLYKLNRDLEKYAQELLLSNKGLEQFSYIISHNLRAPVANILGLTQILESGGNDPGTTDILMHDLVTNVKRLDEVILDLNGILRVKSVVNELKEQISLKELITTIQQSIQSTVEQRSLTINLAGIQIDEFYSLRSYMHSVFMNLLTNTLKYRHPEAEPLVEITSRKESGTIIITYKDNGRGIDMIKNKENIFGLYKRFHRDIEGKGIGLYMIKTQTEILGGKVSLESEVDKGVKFTFEFPLQEKLDDLVLIQKLS